MSARLLADDCVMSGTYISIIIKKKDMKHLHPVQLMKTVQSWTLWLLYMCRGAEFSGSKYVRVKI